MNIKLFKTVQLTPVLRNTLKAF